MKSRPSSDPTSWAYQANIHGTLLAQGQWPADAPFATCEHKTIFFLSWHRMYVYYFERIVRAASGNPDFALPYWNYGRSGQRSLPPPFRTPNAGGSANPLFDGTRNGSVNGGAALPGSAVTAANALSQVNFLGSTAFQRRLESTPHGTVHTSIGGNMGVFATAGRDPIFWLHHCNVDRLWEQWLAQGAGRVNPTGNSAWMNQPFTFVDADKTFVTLSGAEVVDTAGQLGYGYDDPQTCAPAVAMAAIRSASAEPSPEAEEPSVLATFPVASGVAVSSGQERADLRAEGSGLGERLKTALARFAPSGMPGAAAVRVILRFEGVRTDRPLDGYFEVYLGLPPGTKPMFTSPYYVGNLDLFGADAVSRGSMRGAHAGHQGGGLTFEFDVTDIVKQAAARGRIGRDGLEVTLKPAGVPEEAGARFVFGTDAQPRIDSVSLVLRRGS
jgi:tyrosinase